MSGKKYFIIFYKNRGGIHNCTNYRGIRFNFHFMLERLTIEAITHFGRFTETYKEKKADLYMIFVDF